MAAEETKPEHGETNHMEGTALITNKGKAPVTIDITKEHGTGVNIKITKTECITTSFNKDAYDNVLLVSFCFTFTDVLPSNTKSSVMFERDNLLNNPLENVLKG